MSKANKFEPLDQYGNGFKSITKQNFKDLYGMTDSYTGFADFML